MKISKPVLLNSALGVVIVGAIVGGIFVLNPVQASGTDDATQLTTTVQEGVVSSSITASGQIAAASDVTASFDTSGTIATVKIALGDTVKKGQVIGTLETGDLSDAVSDASGDYSDAASDVSAANSAIATAKAHAKSSDAQVKANAAQELSSAEDQLDQTTDQLEQASDTLADAKEALAAAKLKAPISGLVTSLTGVVGATSGGSTGGTDSTGFAVISDVSSMTMTASIAEADIALVETGQTASVTFPALEDVTATATVTAVAPTATASNSVVTYATTITLDEIPDGLRLGQTAEVSITTESSAEDALYVPTAAITTATDGTSTVDVVGDDGETSTVTVTLGVVGDQGTEILSGLEAGETVVLGEVSTSSTSEETTTEQGGFGGGGTGGFTGGGTPPTGGTFPGGN
jgi:macrolide-specific efflux system membrane fusion protein